MTDRAAPSNWMLALLACAQLIIALDATIVFVALPEISRALDFSAQRLQWVVSAYTVAFGGFLLLGGRATDLLGRRRMYVLGQSLYALASLAGGLAQSELPLILARAVQGLGGALLFPATLALIGNHFAEGPARNRALAIWSIPRRSAWPSARRSAARSPSCSAGPRSSWSTCRWPAPRRCSPCA